MSQHTGSHKSSLNLLGEKYLNESHWLMHRIRLLECMLQTSKKLTGHIGFGLCVSASVCLSRTVHARVLKFHIWIPHGKIADTHFFLVRVISLSGVMPL